MSPDAAFEALVSILADNPTMRDDLMAKHALDGDGRCLTCRQGGDGSGRSFGCVLGSAARAAQREADGS